ncbi:hypothetical protein NMG60_11002297 [Bertholletia excelsa]
MKGCELCRNPAKIYCEADRASLCSDCDEKVHCANFLVSKHSRSLLCHICQSPTPWKASGSKLGPTISVCENCVDNCSGKQRRSAENDEENQGGNDDVETEDSFLSEEDYTDDDGEDSEAAYANDVDGYSEDEDGDNQVVPWSSSPPPPLATISSSSSEEVSSSRISPLKRNREDADLDSEDEIGCASSRFNNSITSMVITSKASENEEATSSGLRRPLKLQRSGDASESERFGEHGEMESRPTVAIILSSLEKLQQMQNTMSDREDASAMVLGIRRLSRDPASF